MIWNRQKKKKEEKTRYENQSKWDVFPAFMKKIYSRDKQESGRIKK